MTCDDRRDLMLPYAAGALDADEAAEVRAHLAGGCPRCAVALAEAEATVAQLPLALEPVQPSARAREKLLSRVTESSPMRITPPVPRRRSWLSYALAACIGAVVAGATVQYVYRGINRDLTAALHDERIKFVDLQRMVTSPDLRLAAFQPTEVRRDAYGRILWDRAQNKWHISVFNMAPPKPGQAYELWFFGEDKKPVPGPMLHVDATGTGQMTVDVPTNIGPITLAAFTNEPAQGVQSPTGEIHLKSEIAP